MQDKKEQLKNILESTFSRKPYEIIKLAYLFGSRAKELSEANSNESAVGPLSDYDIGIFIPYEINKSRGLPTAERFKLQSQLAEALDSDVDLVLLNDAPIELQYNVITFGVLLFEKSTAERVEYEARVLGRYGDFLPILHQQKKELIQGGSNETRVQRYRKALRKAERLFEQARTAGG